MSIRFNCAKCRLALAVDEAYVGQEMQCPNCNEALRVPAAVPNATPGAPAAPADSESLGQGNLSPVADLLFDGRKIDAIKFYREQVKPGAGLKESKEAVEQLEAGLRAQHPEKFTAKAKSGCAAILAMLAVLVVVLVWMRF